MTDNWKFQSILCKAVRLGAAALVAIALATPARAFDPAAGDFDKPTEGPPLVRVLIWNVHNNFIYTADDDGRYSRVIKAIKPDVVAFQEMDHSLSAAQVTGRMSSYFPGTTWYAHLGKADGSNTGVSNRNIIVSRYPLSRQRQDTIPTSDIRGVAMAQVDLPDETFEKDLYLMNIHFKAGATEQDREKRQKHADSLINWMRDARTPGGNINLTAGTPMVALGDFNLNDNGDVAPFRPQTTLLNGTIYDTTRYGASSPPDWDGTANTDAAPYDHSTGQAFTHNSSNPGNRIDRFYYTDSVIHHRSGFVLNSRTMSVAARAAAGGIQVNDTSGASDHLPVVVDFALGADPRPPGQLIINEYSANDLGTDESTFLEIKNVGGRDIHLVSPVSYLLKASYPLTNAVPPTENEQYAFELTGVVPPGGLHVLYDGAGHSSGIASTIESRLPARHRQNLSGFVMDNDADSAVALVQRRNFRPNNKPETVVEAYAWGNSNVSETKYFRMAGSNNLLIGLGTNQQTAFFSAPSDLTISRNPGNTDLNTYQGWSLATLPTPGLENPPPASINNWTIY